MIEERGLPMSSIENRGFTTGLQPARSHFQDHWGLYLVEGIVLIVVGVLALVLPPLATLAVTLLLGWLFVLSGASGIVISLWLRHAPGFWWSLLSGVLAIAVGLLLLASPVQGAVTLTVVLVAFFLIDGVASIMFALHHRHDPGGRWGFILVSGIVTLVLAAVILAGLPGSAAWVLGLLFGIDMLFSGIALATVALMSRPH
jgi:uncharacterized membrane protein HdeD (DUF308 family)